MGRSRTSRLWRGSVLFNRYALAMLSASSPRFAGVDVRRSWRAVLEQGGAAGRLEIREDGLHWRAGSLLEGLGFRTTTGGFFVPWPEVADVSVEDAPGYASRLGGQIRIQFVESLISLDGQFPGSQRKLRAALAAAFPDSQRGPRPQPRGLRTTIVSDEGWPEPDASSAVDDQGPIPHLRAPGEEPPSAR